MSLKNLNRIQRSAVEATTGPVLIFAGAGSGKTRVLTHKIYYLIREGLYNPEDILAVTFTNKAAQEMKLRIGKLLKNSNSQIDIAIGTFHSICARILRNHIQHLGYTNNFVIYDSADKRDLIRIILEKYNISKTMMTPKGVASQISLFKNQMISTEEIEQKARTVAEKKLAEVFPLYQKALRDNNAVDFDDLLLLPLELFEKHPRILSAYQNKWKYVLVDEYQDTNLPQFLLVSKLAEKHQQICVVGDDDQSIYG
ncbi:MAG: UvrD-helicase domain-containing protein, partial [Planctomycetia bacterium]|nr:UvrD-helicase domain-containing protein [Planctomycetia bacterium]